MAVFVTPFAPPADGTAATTVTVAVAPRARSPMAQLTVPAACEQVPCVLDEET